MDYIKNHIWDEPTDGHPPRQEQSVIVTVDIVAFTVVPHDKDGQEGDESDDGPVRTDLAADLRVLLLPSARWGQAGWMLPHSPVAECEDLDDAALRTLANEAGLFGVHIEQVAAFGGLHRHARQRVIGIAYYALVQHDLVHFTRPGSRAAWFSAHSLPSPLSFDHGEIIAAAHERLRAQVSTSPVALHLLSEAFTLSQVRGVYEAVGGHVIDKRNFTRAMLSSGYLAPTDHWQQTAAHRPARLYRRALPDSARDLESATAI